MRAPQPPTPPPIIIHECPPLPPTPPPLILRERPPTPPKPIPTEIGLHKRILNILNYIDYIDLYILVTHYLPPPPLTRPRPRLVIINRYPSLPEKQRKRPIFSSLFNYYLCYLGQIIIERWIPYEPQPERQVIVCPTNAPSPMKYLQPYYTTNPYETPNAHIARRFEELVGREYLACYKARYGSSFLVATTPRHRDRDAGIFKDVIYNLLFKKSFKIHIILNYFILVSFYIITFRMPPMFMQEVLAVINEMNSSIEMIVIKEYTFDLITRKYIF